ncbi:MAG: STAS domain-containing protein [Acidobacteriota bacterium]|nr:STAS domain-containing protein [Acidobacteriota bacterium]MDQ7088258.1 STAS domain-containing protein [Acidobacteriota bacterium]
MKIGVHHLDRVCVLEPQGQIVHPEGGRGLRDVFREEVENGQRRFVLDMAGVPYIDSAGVGELVASLKKVREAGGDIKYAAVSQRVSDTLLLLGLVEILEIHASREEAIAAFV